MNIKKFTLATLAGGTAMWILAGVWHGLVAARFYNHETHATHEGTGIIFIAYLVLAGLMAFMYPRGYHGSRPLLAGLKFGAIVGLLWVFPHELAMAGAHGGSIAYVLKNAAWHLVEQSLGGIVIGWTYGRNLAGSPSKPLGREPSKSVTPKGGADENTRPG